MDGKTARFLGFAALNVTVEDLKLFFGETDIVSSS